MKENVLFILVDCLRADKCYGDNRTAKTPNIDSLIKRGTFFTKTIATTTTTTPSVASIFTGLYTFGHGIRSLSGYKLADNVKTLAEIFKESGYNTYAEVTGPLVSSTGLNRGFDVYSHRAPDVYSHRNPRGSFVDKWGDTLIAKFKNGELKEPWFVFVHLWELHEPRRIPDSFNNNKFGSNKYERALSSLDAKLGEMLNYIDFATTTVIVHGDHGEKIFETMLGDCLYEIQQRISDILRKIFAGVIRKIFKLLRLDYNKLPDFAKYNYIPKIEKPSMLKLIGHGFHIYDSALVTPLIISGNKERFPADKFISTQVRQIDIFPTLIEAFNLYCTENLNIHGRSLLPLMKGKNLDIIPAYCEACGVVLGDKKYWKRGLRTSNHKYIDRPYSDKKYEELYDLEKDPLERRNIARSQSQIVEALKRKLISITEDGIEDIKLSGRKMSDEEEKDLTERLKNLGYLD